jgi:hypothetical protein
MCYSTESSFGTFVFVLAICIYLWIHGNNLQKAISIILFFISLMQLIEGFIWLNIKCTQINKIISLFIPALLYLQPIVALTTVSYFKVGLLSSMIYTTLLCVWLLMLPFFLYWSKSIMGKCTTIAKNGHLAWPSQPVVKLDIVINILYILAMGTAIITLNTPWYGIFYGIIATISYVVTKSTYGRSWSSMWCHFINILEVAALFI